MLIPTVLIVDDDESELDRFAAIAHRLHWHVLRATGAYMASDILSEQTSIAAIITDTNMGEGNGIDLLQMLYRFYWRTEGRPRILIHSRESDFRHHGDYIPDLAWHVETYFGEIATFARKSELTVRQFLTTPPRTDANTEAAPS